jgi:hypothetical protein
MIKDRLSTRNLLRRKNMQLDSFNCVLCSFITEESRSHLFLDCPFAAACWFQIGVEIPLQSSVPDIFQQIKDQLAHPFFMESILLMCWAIWNTRNDLIFKGVQPNLEECHRRFLKECSLLRLRVKPSLEQRFLSWIQNLA